MEKKQLHSTAGVITGLISSSNNSTVKSKALSVLSSIGFNYTFTLPFLSSPDTLLQRAAITGIIRYAGTEAERSPAIEILKQLSNSPEPSQRISAIKCISEIESSAFERDFDRLLNDPVIEVQKAALGTIGLKTGKQTILQLVGLFSAHEKEVTEAFVKAGSKSLDAVKELLLHHSPDQKQKQKLILACGRISGKAVQQFLLDLFTKFPSESYTIIKALNKTGFHADERNMARIDFITQNHLMRAVEILFMLNRSRSTHEIKPFMYDSLQLELFDIRETLLNLFSFYSNKEQVDKIKKALYLNKKEIAANALELIEVTIKKEHASTFNTAFEDADLTVRCAALKKLIPETAYADIQKVIIRVLQEENTFFNHWTKACSLHTSKQSSLNIDREIIHRYLQSESILLRETAAYAVL